MASWELLDERSESDLHKTRLLNVEEKPFKRITKRLGAISSAVSQALKTPNASNNGDQTLPTIDTTQLQEELTLDFAAFDSNIARLQFLHDANERERLRYEADKQHILDECQSVREKNGQLREHLEGAKATLTQRKKFDDLAEKITSNRLLRPREDQVASLAKLEDECRELERESETYSATWKERRDQFNRIMEEGMLLRRQIRDEKEEVDRREGMNEGTGDDGGAATPRSVVGTPLPDGEAPTKGGDTPRPMSAGTPGPDSLQVPTSHAESQSRSGSNAASEAGTPLRFREGTEAPDGSNDVDMDEPAVASGTASERGDDEDQTPVQGGETMEVDS